MLKDVSDCGALLADQVGFRMSNFDEDRDAAHFHVGVAQHIVPATQPGTPPLLSPYQKVANRNFFSFLHEVLVKKLLARWI